MSYVLELMHRTPGGAAADASLRGDWEELRADIVAAVAHETELTLRRKTGSHWPRDTDFSANRFRADDIAHSDDILITNSAPYAAAVNNRRTYPSGRPNPNYKAVERTIESQTAKILRKAQSRLL